MSKAEELPPKMRTGKSNSIKYIIQFESAFKTGVKICAFFKIIIDYVSIFDIISANVETI